MLLDFWLVAFFGMRRPQCPSENHRCDCGSLLKYHFYYYRYYPKYIVQQSLILVQLGETVNAIFFDKTWKQQCGEIIDLAAILYLKVYLRFFFDNYFG